MQKIALLFALFSLFVAGGSAQTSMVLGSQDISCFGNNDGLITVLVLGCDGPYTYTINSGAPQNITSMPGDFQWANDEGDGGDDRGLDVTVDTLDNAYVTGYFTGTIVIGSDTLVSLGGTDAFVAKYDAAGAPVWAIRAGGMGFDAGNSVEISPTGDVYFTGYFENTAQFDTAVINANGGFDIFLARYDANGNYIWALNEGGPDTDQGKDISFDQFGDIYLTGEFMTSMNIGMNNLTSLGAADIFAAKYDDTGAPFWAISAGGDTNDAVSEIKVTNSGDDFYLAGRFEGMPFFDTVQISSAGGSDIFIARYGTLNGSFQWVERAGGPGEDGARGLDVDATGDAYVTGFTTAGTVTFDTITATGAGNMDHFVTKYDTAGGVEWLTLSGGSGFDVGYRINTDDAGVSFVCGEIGPNAIFGGQTIPQVGNNDAVVAKVGPGGDIMWATSGGGTSYENALGLAATSSKEIYLTGYFSGTGDFGSNTVTSNGGNDMYITKLGAGFNAVDTIPNLFAGNYIIDLTDAHGNVITDSVELDQPDSITLSATTTAASSSIATDGSIDLTVSGGTSPYSYNWDSGDTTQDLSNKSFGFYTVTVTDSLGCTKELTAYIDTLVPLTLNIVTTDVTCIVGNNGTIDLTVFGGTPPYTYAWSNGPTTEDQTGLASGTYTVTVTDSVGTTATATDSVGSNPINPGPNVGNINGPILVVGFQSYFYQVSPPNNGSTYSWSINGGTLVSSSNNVATVNWGQGPVGTVTVIETNIHGCSDSTSNDVTISVNGVEELSLEHTLRIYPNPATERLTIASVPGTNRSIQVEMISITGKRVYANNFYTAFGNEHQVDLSGIAKGIYMLKMNDGMETVFNKVIVR